MAVIKVGAATEVELKEKKARVEDALHATRAAVEEGIIPGGGVTLLRSAHAIDKLTLEGDQKLGAEILKRALEEPTRQLVRNAGLEGSVIVEHLSHEKRTNWGFDVMSEDYVDLVKAGIIDPAKVTRTALENAASVAAMILTTEALVSDMPEKKSAAAMPGRRRRYVRLRDRPFDPAPSPCLRGEGALFFNFIGEENFGAAAVRVLYERFVADFPHQPGRRFQVGGDLVRRVSVRPKGGRATPPSRQARSRSGFG